MTPYRNALFLLLLLCSPLLPAQTIFKDGFEGAAAKNPPHSRHYAAFGVTGV